MTTQTVAVAVQGDLLDEPDERFKVNLWGAVNATVLDGEGLGTIVDDDEPAVPPSRRYDFGISGSPVQAGFVAVLPQDVYSAIKGYGWVSRVAGADRNDPAMSALRRDLIYGGDATFRVNLDRTKTYSIRLYHSNPRSFGTVSYVNAIYQGNPSAGGSTSYVADNFSVYVEGVLKYTVSVVPAAGTVVRTISNVTVSADGVLDLRFRDLGGQNTNFVVSGLEISSGALPAQAPLLAEGDPRDDGGAAVTLGQLQPVVAEAAARWAATGLTADQSAALSQTRFVVADLGAAVLGLADPAAKSVRIDDDAAGFGWSVSGERLPITDDRSPITDDQPPMTDDRSPITGIDLLTVVMHEMGHVLGYGHSDDASDLMAPVLSARGNRAKAVEPLGPAEWRSEVKVLGASETPFADLGDDGSTGAWRAGRMPQDEESTSAELLEFGVGDLMRAEAAASFAEEAVQLRVPRRSRLSRYEREVDAWFDRLARDAGESPNATTSEPR